MHHILIRLMHPRLKRYPRRREILWCLKHTEISQDEVSWWQSALGQGLMPHKLPLEVIGSASPELKSMGRLVMRFAMFSKLKVRVAVGEGQEPRFEHWPRRRVVLGSTSLLAALHELGHAKFGRSEAVACAWSTAMWLKVTGAPIAKLKWVRHMIVNEAEFTGMAGHRIEKG